MSERGQVPFGDTVIHYTVIRSGRRRKTVEITLDPNDGVLVAAPLETSPEKVRVVVHELTHLRVRTHTPVFWAEVAKLLPDYGLRRARLREIGATLTF